MGKQPETMVQTSRWEAAQAYEAGYWAAQASAVAEGRATDLDWYRWRAEELCAWLNAAGLSRLTAGEARVVEVGSGPLGLATFFPSISPVLVDPLHDHYGTLDSLTKLRKVEARYLTGRGEALPVPDASFDLVVIENCIDHVQDTAGVMRELTRVMAPDGILYLTVNCRSGAGYYVHRLLSSLQLDPGHPHTFTPTRLIAMLEKLGFEIVDLKTGSYTRALAEDLRGPGVRPRLKAVLGVSEFLCSVLARRSG